MRGRAYQHRHAVLTSTRFLAVGLALVIGAVVGLGSYTFVYAGGHAYLSSDPRVCLNCHVMRDQYDGWTKSSHHAVATCNDCHMPHALLPKLATKAANGFFHSLAFTTGNYPDPIRIKGWNREIAERSCRTCHGDIVHQMDTVTRAGDDAASCVRCHGSVGHPTFMAPAPGPAR